MRHSVEGGDWKTYYVPFDAKGYDLKSYVEDGTSAAYYGSHQVMFLSTQSAADHGVKKPFGTRRDDP